MSAEEADDQRHAHAENQARVVKGHGHGQDSSAQRTLEQMRQGAAGTGSIGIAVLEGIVGILCEGELVLLR